jgi:hypothetical protein
MPIATKQPPADPITIYCASDAHTGLWNATLSNGTIVSTESKNVANDIIAALHATDPSTQLFIWGPSGNMLLNCQLADLVAGMLPNQT